MVREVVYGTVYYIVLLFPYQRTVETNEYSYDYIVANREIQAQISLITVLQNEFGFNVYVSI